MFLNLKQVYGEVFDACGPSPAIRLVVSHNTEHASYEPVVFVGGIERVLTKIRHWDCLKSFPRGYLLQITESNSKFEFVISLQSFSDSYFHAYVESELEVKTC